MSCKAAKVMLRWSQENERITWFLTSINEYRLGAM